LFAKLTADYSFILLVASGVMAFLFIKSAIARQNLELQKQNAEAYRDMAARKQEVIMQLEKRLSELEARVARLEEERERYRSQNLELQEEGRRKDALINALQEENGRLIRAQPRGS
jgi:septal ring factor EnvC (AmiA/AmiB activator)